MQEISKVKERLREDPSSTLVKASTHSTQVVQRELCDIMQKQNNLILFGLEEKGMASQNSKMKLIYSSLMMK